ncbi:hypothetical protein NHX12_020771 [Muraenolepis orangiensis]|uniref:Myb-like domain-containing protein n=1 Tax=Muraenolepis orangiensis TaxID=630683 RepID=A0A9Q0EVJ2_9TELE|nr:hypothetical protein NHX12_020771 [Muraenolepis orangiensis]
MVEWLVGVPSLLHDTLQSFGQQEDMKMALEHHGNRGHFEEKDPSLLPMDDCILYSLSLPPKTRLEAGSTSPDLALPSDNTDRPAAEEDRSRRGAERARQRREKRDQVTAQIKAKTESLGDSDAMVPDDAPPSPAGLSPPAEPLANEDVYISIGGRELRKRKLSRPSEPPAKQTLKRSLSLRIKPPTLPDPRAASYQATAESKAPWSDDETLQLLDIWGKGSVQQGLQSCLKNRPVFTLIARRMAQRGHPRSVEQCQTRIKRLKKAFRRCLKRNRSVPWSDAETLALVNTWGREHVQYELTGGLRRGPGFTSIANKMVAQGYSRTAEQCKSRLKRLKSTFRQCYDNNMKGKGHVECKFYEQLGRILTNDLSFADVFDDGAVERRKVPWSDKETVILLELWGDHQGQHSSRRGPHNGHVFTDIAEKLGANGFYRSADQCHTRVKRLKASYRHARENLRVSGSDKIDFKFYDLLEQIVEKQPSTSSSQLVNDAIEISDDSDSESTPGAEATASSSPKVWSDEETLALIGVWGEPEVQRALRGSVHNGHVYAEIAERMRRLGHAKSQEQCRWKVKALRAHFRQSRKNKGDYKFYSQLELILAGTNGAVSGPWSEPETVTLIQMWASDDLQESLRTCVHNSHIYGEIASRMAALGHPRTAEQCQLRMKNLKKTYRSFCNSRRSGGHPMLFTYYQLMEPVLGDGLPTGPATGDLTGVDNSLMSLLDTEDDLGTLTLGGSTELLQAESSRKMPWSERETETLLGVWGEDGVQLNLAAGGRTRHLYDYIAQKMQGLGFLRSPEQCNTRVKRLRTAYQHDKSVTPRCVVSPPALGHTSTPPTGSYLYSPHWVIPPLPPLGHTSTPYWVIPPLPPLGHTSTPPTGSYLHSPHWVIPPPPTGSYLHPPLGHTSTPYWVIPPPPHWVIPPLPPLGLTSTPHWVTPPPPTGSHLHPLLGHTSTPYWVIPPPPTGSYLHPPHWVIPPLPPLGHTSTPPTGSYLHPPHWVTPPPPTGSYLHPPLGHTSTPHWVIPPPLPLGHTSTPPHWVTPPPPTGSYLHPSHWVIPPPPTGSYLHPLLGHTSTPPHWVIPPPPTGKDFKYFDQMERIYNKVVNAAEILPEIHDIDQDLAALLPAVDVGKQVWGEEETELLLELWGSEEVREALRSSNKTMPMLTQVSLTMADQGFQRTAQQCQTRIKRLKRTFRRCLDDSRAGAEKQECKYFEQLLRVFGAQYVDGDALASASQDMDEGDQSHASL